MLDDNQLLRYSRHILLPQFDIQGQERVNRARVLIVGMGGLGSPVGLYLAAAGVGHLVLVDHDRVDVTNLQRQIVYATGDVGSNKAEAAAEHLRRLNPDVRITQIVARLADDALLEQVALADVVIDASDNFPTRFALNAACVQHAKPLVSGAAIRMEAQISVFTNTSADSPCYRCLYKDEPGPADACSQSGVLGPLVGIIGSMQALEALKILSGIGTSLGGRLLLLDAQQLEWRTLRLRRDPACPVCGPKNNATQAASSP
ncbi:MAG: molybdopterin-synthase adenylyltransferase MoeB [Gammaproteobacteria bacterium]|nr:molybdopterin-synthase adenylyltransferase MoeB [Gammaproteobacteria bacterium]